MPSGRSATAVYVLPLLFFKRLSDVYAEEYQALLAKYKEEEIARAKFHRFVIPKGCQWEDIRKQAQNVGQKLNDVLAQIAKANPELEGVVNRVDFNKQDEIPKERLVRLIEQFSQIKLGNRDAEPDVLGNVYEYLLKKFNEEAPQRAGEFYTPREVVWTMVSILDPKEGFEVYESMLRERRHVDHVPLLSGEQEGRAEEALPLRRRDQR